MKEICVVIQPFDKDKFDDRYKDLIKPAIEECGYIPYRVDEDPSVEIVIDTIEKKISECALCIAEITTNNPNVWYEVGYANAKGKKVIMLCSDERGSESFPFDIRHRSILTYSTKSPSGYESLKSKLIGRLKASNVSKGVTTPSDLEIELLKYLNNQSNTQYEVVPKERIAEPNRQEVLQSLKNLVNNGYLEYFYSVNENGKQNSYYRVTEKAMPYLT